MRPVQNRWEIKQAHFHPFTKPQKIKTSMCRSKLLKFHLNQAGFGQGSSQSEILGKIMCQSKRAVHFLTPDLMESSEQEKLVSPLQLQQQLQTSFVKTQRIFQSKPNIISPMLSISNIWDVRFLYRHNSCFTYHLFLFSIFFILYIREQPY